MLRSELCLRNLLLVSVFSFAGLLGVAECGAQGSRAQTDPAPSHVDIYGGYAYIHPFHSAIAGVPYHDVGNLNTTISVTDYFTRHFGLQVEGSYFSGGSKRGVFYQCSPSCASRDQLFYAAEAGPIFRFPMGRFTPYVHVLAGGARVNGPYVQPLTWGAGLTGGGGLDYTLPFAGNHLAVRLFQADMYYSHVNYSGSPVPVPVGSTLAVSTRSNVGDVLAVKGSAGLVFKFGTVGPPPLPLALTCTVQPETAYPGDTVAVACTPANLNPKRPADYTLTSNGGQLTPSGSSASISTTGLAPGSYTVNARLSQGAKAYQQASWNGNFTVRAYDPPTVTAFTVTPADVPAGDTATGTCSATSPQNRPLTYAYSTSAGQISGTGATATFLSVGLPPSPYPITLTCTATDDQGRSSSASTTVTIVQGGTSGNTVTIPKPGDSKGLCTISFERDRKRPVRVNNEAKACLDDVSLNLNRDYTNRLVIVGHQEPGEPAQTAAQRARNESLYLIQEKGIDPSRLELRASTTAGRSADNILLLHGTPSPADRESTIVNASTIPHDGEAYGRPRAHARHSRHRKGPQRKRRHS